MNRDEKEMKTGDLKKEHSSPKISDQTSMPQQVVDKSALPPKKKRKSPAVPWKKPKDMPKRPLSSYNLFFAAERQNLIEKLSAGPVKGKQTGDEDKEQEGKEEECAKADASIVEAEASQVADPEKKQMKTPGVGFANLAKIIAAKWKSLDPKERAPFEEQASRDKARYDEAVAKWRVKQKDEQARKKEKASPEKSPKDESTIASSGSIQAIVPDVFEASSTEDTDPYPAQWFDVSPMAATASGEGFDSISEDTSRLFEDYSAFDYSQQSLDHGGSPAVRRFFPVEPQRSPAALSSLLVVPTSPETSIHQLSLPRRSSGNPRRMEDFQWGATAYNLQQRHSQMEDVLASHEFALSSVSGETSAPHMQQQSSQFRPVQLQGSQFRYPEREGHRQPGSFQWDMERSRGSFPGSSMLAPVSHPSQSTSTRAASSRGHYDPLPMDAPPVGLQYQPIQRSYSMTDQRTGTGSREVQQPMGAPPPHSAQARLLRASMETSRTRRAIAPSLEPAPQIFRPALSLAPQQVHQQRPHPSIIHSNTPQSSDSGQGAFNITASTRTRQQQEQDHAVAADHAQASPPQQGSTSEAAATSRKPGNQRHLDDDTIDFITGAPFP